jgi:F-type H+-transporting ATPase subunit epsilon
MASGKIQIEIVTPARRVMTEVVDEVRAPGAAGGFGVRPGHTPFVSSLKAGALELVTGGAVETYAVGEGFVQVSDDQVLVLAETAERAEDIDLAKARAEAEAARQKLAGLATGEGEFALQQALVDRAAARVLVAERRR